MSRALLIALVPLVALGACVSAEDEGPEAQETASQEEGANTESADDSGDGEASAEDSGEPDDESVPTEETDTGPEETDADPGEDTASADTGEEDTAPVDTDAADTDLQDTDDSDVEVVPGFTVLSSDEPRADASDVSDARVAALTSGMWDLSFALSDWQRAEGPNQNQFFSAVSVSMALALLRAGAKGETGEEIDLALRFPEPVPGLHDVFNRFDQLLAARNGPSGSEPGSYPTVRVVNALWGPEGTPWVPSYLDILSTRYGAALRVIDFATDPHRARGIINEAIAEETEGLIPELLPVGFIRPNTQLVLTNALYFKGAWVSPFEPSLTTEGTFDNLDGSTAPVPMMRMGEEEDLPYGRFGEVEVVELPYKGEDLSMVLIVPPRGKLGSLEAGLSAAQLQGWIDDLEVSRGSLSMPRFEVDVSVVLGEALESMGMVRAFGGGDFTGISASAREVSEILHQGVLKVDEAGTEAAAATAVGLADTGVVDPWSVTVDRPFLLVIRDRPTGAPLFFGRVVGL